MQALKLSLAIAIVALFATSCTSVSTSKNTGESLSAGYRSVSLANTAQNNEPDGMTEVHNAIQRSIRNRFKTRGLIYGSPNPDLIVAYMLIGEDSGTSTINADYFGSGRNANAILEQAQKRGIITSKRPPALKSGALVIDILDAKSNQLVFRNSTARSLLGVKPVERNAVINVAIAQTLAPFFN